jgi:hypothetical protein
VRTNFLPPASNAASGFEQTVDIRWVRVINVTQQAGYGPIMNGLFVGRAQLAVSTCKRPCDSTVSYIELP